MKRYWLFHCDYYYPGGGMNDFVDSFDTEEEGRRVGILLSVGASHDGEPWSEAHIVDSATGAVLEIKEKVQWRI